MIVPHGRGNQFDLDNVAWRAMTLLDWLMRISPAAIATLSANPVNDNCKYSCLLLLLTGCQIIFISIQSTHTLKECHTILLLFLRPIIPISQRTFAILTSLMRRRPSKALFTLSIPIRDDKNTTTFWYRYYYNTGLRAYFLDQSWCNEILCNGDEM